MEFIKFISLRDQKQNNFLFDTKLFFSVVFLLFFGLIMVYSASIAIADNIKAHSYEQYFFVLRQGIYVLIGSIVGLLVYQVKIETWQKLSLPLFLIGTISLIFVLLPGIGREINGAKRWMNLGIINLQPSEFMKILAVLYSADYITRKKDILNNFKLSFLPMLCVILFVGGLLLIEPDFGAFIVISFISFSILFLGGVKLRGFLFLIVFAIIGFIIIIISSPYRLARVIGFLDPWQDPYGKGYQLSHSLIAFGRGEFFGVGLGRSVEKLFYLPEAHTDFLMAVIGEELGFIGVCIVICLFAIVIYKSFKIGDIAKKNNMDYASLVAKGIGLWFGFQCFINIGVNIGLLPTKGLTLPLMSFGGSSMLANLIAIAILFRIDYESRKSA